MNILQLNTSARSIGSQSTRLAEAITSRLKLHHPGATVVLRDFAKAPHPPLDEFALTARFTPSSQRTPDQHARVARDSELITELKAADLLVFGVPMYNFHIPVQFKAWIDAVAQAGETFRYTESGPEGLLVAKKAYVALTRGGVYRETAADMQVPYLKSVLGFVGITSVELIYAEGLAMGEEIARNGFADAEARIDALFA